MHPPSLLRPCLLYLALLIPMAAAAGERRVVGQLETIRVEEAKLGFIARIDTGAATTSIHATGIRIDQPAARKLDNRGKTIHFLVSNRRGEQHRLSTTIREVAEVSNAQGTEFRYVVELTLAWNGDHKKVRVNLRDRSAMSYKLLIGRNWLRDDYLVNVDLNRPE